MQEKRQLLKLGSAMMVLGGIYGAFRLFVIGERNKHFTFGADNRDEHLFQMLDLERSSPWAAEALDDILGKHRVNWILEEAWIDGKFVRVYARNMLRNRTAIMTFDPTVDCSGNAGSNYIFFCAPKCSEIPRIISIGYNENHGAELLEIVETNPNNLAEQAWMNYNFIDQIIDKTNAEGCVYAYCENGKIFL